MSEEQEPATSEEVIPEVEQETESSEVAEHEAATSEEEVGDEGTEKPNTGKYANVEELHKGYENINKAYTQSQQENARLREELRRKQQTESQLPNPEEEVAEFVRKAQVNPVSAIRDVVRRETRQVEARTKATVFATEYHQRMTNPEFKNLEPVMAEIATQYSDMIQQNGLQDDPRLLDILFLAAKGASQSNVVKRTKAQAKAEGEASARQKAKAQIEGGSSTRSVQHKSIDDMTASQLKAHILKGNK